MDGGKIEEFKGFLEELKRYRDALCNPNSILGEEKPKKRTFLGEFLEDRFPKKSKEELIEELIEELREELVFKHGTLKDEIAKLIGRTDMTQFNKTWNRALNPIFGIGTSKEAISLCIDYTLEAIGRLDKKENRRKLEEFEELFGTSTAKNRKKAEPELLVKNDEKSNYQKIWQWIDTHRILSILGALAAIATIGGVIFAVFN